MSALDEATALLSQIAVARGSCNRAATERFARALAGVLATPEHALLGAAALDLAESVGDEGWDDWDAVDLRIGTVALALQTARSGAPSEPR